MNTIITKNMKYGQKVEITGGFYEGLKGILKQEYNGEKYGVELYYYNENIISVVSVVIDREFLSVIE